jgi:hypothetical protein
MSVGYARDHQENSPKNKAAQSPLPIFKTLEEWEPVKSTKMDTCARICRYMLIRDNLAPVIFREGQAIFPKIPPAQPGRVKTETKILIYQEFTSLKPLLVNVTTPSLSFN